MYLNFLIGVLSSEKGVILLVGDVKGNINRKIEFEFSSYQITRNIVR